MKKIFLISLISFITVICTGCVKYDYNIEIDKKDNVKFSETLSLNQKLFSALSTDFDNAYKLSLDKLTNKYKSKGYDVQEYKDSDFSGITISKEKLTVNKLKESLPEGFIKDSASVIVQRGFIKNSYKIHLLYDIRIVLSSSDVAQVQSALTAKEKNVIISNKSVVRRINNQFIDMTKINERYNSIPGKKPGIIPESVLTIKIPAKAIKHNASEVLSDNCYSWNLALKSQPVEIILEYDTYDISKFSTAISMIILLGAVFYLVNRVRKNDVIKGL